MFEFTVIAQGRRRNDDSELGRPARATATDGYPDEAETVLIKAATGSGYKGVTFSRWQARQLKQSRATLLAMAAQSGKL